MVLNVHLVATYMILCWKTKAESRMTVRSSLANDPCRKHVMLHNETALFLYCGAELISPSIIV